MNKTCPFCLIIMILIVAFSPLDAQNVDSLFSPVLGRQKPTVDYSFEAYETKALDMSHDPAGRSGQFRSQRHDLSFTVPLSQSQDSEWLLLSSLNLWDIDTDARLYNSNDAAFPDKLYDVSMGTAYRWRLDNDWIAGAVLSFDSSSDKPYDSMDETDITALAMLQVPVRERNAWYFMLAYTYGPGEIADFPLPGMAYFWNPDDSFNMLLGFPFSRLNWQPAPWHLSANAGINGVGGKVALDVTDTVQLYSGYNWDYQTYYRSGREDDDFGLTYLEQRVAAGVRWQCLENLSIDTYVGYAFERKFYEDEDFDDDDRNRITLSDGMVAGIQARLTF